MFPFTGNIAAGDNDDDDETRLVSVEDIFTWDYS